MLRRRKAIDSEAEGPDPVQAQHDRAIARAMARERAAEKRRGAPPPPTGTDCSPTPQTVDWAVRQFPGLSPEEARKMIEAFGG